ncbi:MAG: IS6 family transposase [Steroidobacteraceae bacterium]
MDANPGSALGANQHWYITYRLSYRDLAAMMAERGVVVSHSTILRWVLRYVPEYEARWARYAKPVSSSWRMDETAVRVRGGNHYLYRAVDKYGKSVDSLLCAGRDRAAAEAFFERAVAKQDARWPDKINVDGYAATHVALRTLGKKDRRWRSVDVRCNRYLNNFVEQDHRAIKRRCASMLGLKTFESAAVTFSGIELAHRIRKRQFLLPAAGGKNCASLKELWDIALGDRQQQLGSSHPDRWPIANAPELNRRRTRPREGRRIEKAGSRRYSRKVTIGRGLYMLVTPRGGRYWRYDYRFRGKHKTLALGVYPDTPLEAATRAHKAARSMLARGLDPSPQRGRVILSPSQHSDS